MTDIVATAAYIGRADPDNDEVLSVVLAETATAGQTAYQTTTGTFGLCDGNGSGKQQFRGIFLQGGAAGQVVPLLKRGFVEGFTVSGLDGDAPLYVSDTAGSLDDGVGTMTVVCGRVTITPNGTKIAYIDAQWAQIWS